MQLVLECDMCENTRDVLSKFNDLNVCSQCRRRLVAPKLRKEKKEEDEYVPKKKAKY